jgi:hypothetical protein
MDEEKVKAISNLFIERGADLYLGRRKALPIKSNSIRDTRNPIKPFESLE